MAVALLALVISLGGSAAVAATLIDGSTIKRDTVTGRQVKEPSLDTVPRAQRLEQLRPGQSMSGVFAAGSGDLGDYIGTGVTFPRPLANPIPNNNVIQQPQSDPGTTACPGAGQAAPGYMCLYTSNQNHVGDVVAYSDNEYILAGTRSVGVAMLWFATGENPRITGVWTVTAPANP